MSVFSTTPSEWGTLVNLAEWISGNEAADISLAGLVEDLLPEPDDSDFAGQSWLHCAWTSVRSPGKSAAYLWLMQHRDWDENEQKEGGDDFTALADFARKYAVQIRGCLIEPARPAQIADALSTLADVLNQDVREETAAFIIEMVSNAKLPVLLVNELFRRVAMAEAGKIKPASFTRLLQVMQSRLKQARLATWDVRTFATELEPALAYFQEHMSDEKPQTGKS